MAGLTVAVFLVPQVLAYAAAAACSGRRVVGRGPRALLMIGWQLAAWTDLGENGKLVDRFLAFLTDV